MSNEESIRKALIYNQAEAMRAIMDRDDRIRDLEADLASLNHRLKCRNAEISALNATKAYLAHQIALLEALIDNAKCPKCGGDPFVRPAQEVRAAFVGVDEDPD